MTTQQTERKESRVNFAFKLIGNLKHDNKLFDRTCPNCKGMYSSYEYTNCPKCNAALTYIMTNNGDKSRAMAISEGTLGLCFGPKQEEKDAKAIKNRKNGLHPVYRFKRFCFADDNGVLGVPLDHLRMKSGTQVELTIINHQLIPSGPFNTKKHGPSIELMALIYDDQGYGDTITVLRDAPAARAAKIPINVDANGSPRPASVEGMQDEIAALEQRITAMKAAAVAQPAVQPAAQLPVVDNTAAVAEIPEPAFEETVITDDAIDPFGGAS